MLSGGLCGLVGAELVEWFWIIDGAVEDPGTEKVDPVAAKGDCNPRDGAIGVTGEVIGWGNMPPNGGWSH